MNDDAVARHGGLAGAGDRDERPVLGPVAVRPRAGADVIDLREYDVARAGDEADDGRVGTGSLSAAFRRKVPVSCLRVGTLLPSGTSTAACAGA